MSKMQLKYQELENKIGHLVGKDVYCDGFCFKITHFTNLFVWGIQYKCDNEYKLDTDITFYSCGTSETYRHFVKDSINNKFKMKVSSFYSYTIVDDFENTYFIDSKKQDYYVTSYFKNNVPILNYIQKVKALVYSMTYGQMSRLDQQYYYNYRVELIKRHFGKYEFIIIDLYNETLEKDTDGLDDELKKVFEELKIYDDYIKLYEEYLVLVKPT